MTSVILKSFYVLGIRIQNVIIYGDIYYFEQRFFHIDTMHDEDSFLYFHSLTADFILYFPKHFRTMEFPILHV